MLLYETVLIALGICLAVWWVRRPSGGQRAPEGGWGAAGDELGLMFAEGSVGNPEAIIGALDGFSVCVERFTTVLAEGAMSSTRVMAMGGGLPEGLVLSHKQLEDGRLIDPDDTMVVALLGDEARLLVTQLITEGGKVVDGSVLIETPGVLSDGPEIVRRVRLVTGVADALRTVAQAKIQPTQGALSLEPEIGAVSLADEEPA